MLFLIVREGVKNPHLNPPFQKQPPILETPHFSKIQTPSPLSHTILQVHWKFFKKPKILQLSQIYLVHLNPDKNITTIQ